MRIRLKSFFHFDVSKAFGNDEIELSRGGATIKTLLQEIARRSEGAIEAIDPHSGLLSTEYFVLVNGRDLGTLPEGLETVLREGDEVGLGTNYFWGGG
ncbi:MAG: MoaD/ThiS family protein [Chloroflexi bacterium]|nr:MoaD/ThiS family protein [Chloroflexota bacterium]